MTEATATRTTDSDTEARPSEVAAPCDCSRIWPENARKQIDDAWSFVCERYGERPVRHQEFARIVGETVARHLMKELRVWTEKHAAVRLWDEKGRSVL